jgi:hypothetical protein
VPPLQPGISSYNAWQSAMASAPAGRISLSNSIDAIADIDAHAFHAVHHVQLGDTQTGYAVDLDRPLQCCRVKPAATLIAAISRLMEEFISMAMTFWLCKVFKMT